MKKNSLLIVVFTAFLLLLAYNMTKTKQSVDDSNFNTTNSDKSVDYSDYGFVNTYGMNEWLEIVDYNFDDPQNSYVSTSNSSHNSYFIVNFSGKYVQLRLYGDGLFGSSYGHYKGDYNTGELYDELSFYEVVDNQVLKLDGSNLMKIEKVEIHSGIPIIYTNQKRFPMVIPTRFLDVSRTSDEPRFYIKPEYIQKTDR